jgi:tRNA modification GTPase
MSYHTDDTICAIATAPGGAARGMVRVSGRNVAAVVGQIFETDTLSPLADVRNATAIQGHVRIDLDAPNKSRSHDDKPAHQRTESRRLPCSLFFWPSARSYTREPVCELHTIGSSPLLQALLATLCCNGARLAEPGEFTLRAFLAGRLDLTQAEGVLGVIDAHGEAELRGALSQLAGGISGPLRQLRELLLQLLAELEAGLDFVDEDIEFVSSDAAQQRLQTARQALDGVAQQMAMRHRTGQALQVVLTGAPNAGKSSLFNALITRHSGANIGDRSPWAPALVSPQRGTTRDYLSATIDLDNLQCELVDTAGRNDGGPDDAERFSTLPTRRFAGIDSEARLIAAERSERAAIRVCCVDSTQRDALSALNVTGCGVVVFTKADVAPQVLDANAFKSAELPIVATSSRTGEGLDELCIILRKILTNDAAQQFGQVVSVTADRCRESIRQADAALKRAMEILAFAGGDELVAAELRTALSEFGKVVGAVYTDDVLDRIFSSFCIGK